MSNPETYNPTPESSIANSRRSRRGLAIGAVVLSSAALIGVSVDVAIPPSGTKMTIDCERDASEPVNTFTFRIDTVTTADRQIDVIGRDGQVTTIPYQAANGFNEQQEQRFKVGSSTHTYAEVEHGGTVNDEIQAGPTHMYISYAAHNPNFSTIDSKPDGYNIAAVTAC